DAARRVDCLTGAAALRGPGRIDHDELRAVPLAFLLQHGPDRPRRDLEKRTVFVRPLLDQRTCARAANPSGRRRSRRARTRALILFVAPYPSAFGQPSSVPSAAVFGRECGWNLEWRNLRQR